MAVISEQLSERVQELTARLRTLKTDFQEFSDSQHVSGLEVHPRLREEIARIYDEHGGLPILMKITKVARDTILKWYTRYKADPLYFQSMPLHRRCYRKGDKSSCEANIRKFLTQATVYRDAKTVEEMRALLPREVLQSVDRLNQKLDREHGLTPLQKMEILKDVIRAGDVRSVALLLGLNRRTILSWKGYFAPAIAEVNSEQNKHQ